MWLQKSIRYINPLHCKLAFTYGYRITKRVIRSIIGWAYRLMFRFAQPNRPNTNCAMHDGTVCSICLYFSPFLQFNFRANAAYRCITSIDQYTNRNNEGNFVVIICSQNALMHLQRITVVRFFKKIFSCHYKLAHFIPHDFFFSWFSILNLLGFFFSQIHPLREWPYLSIEWTKLNWWDFFFLL